jgi:hypothetical protein
MGTATVPTPTSRQTCGQATLTTLSPRLRDCFGVLRNHLQVKLYLQLDNSAKDNKNQFLMGFLSMLTYRRVFKEIQAGFLLVGHTHEDIDAYFSHLSKTLKSQNTYIVADLMLAFMKSQELSFMPEFVQEVADFKTFVEGYLIDGADVLVGLGNMHLFKFYVDESGWPVMRFKEFAVDQHWLPRNKPAIRLFKADADGNPKIPSGIPNPVPFKNLWGGEIVASTGNQDKAREQVSKNLVKKSFLKGGIQGYIEFWERGMLECSGFRKDFPPYIDYWKGILAELEKPLPPTVTTLVEGFWPNHDWSGMESAPLCLLPETDVTPEDEEPEPYCGPKSAQPKPALDPWRDVLPGAWVLLRPSDPDIYPVWLGRACSAVNRDERNADYGQFTIEFWEPRNRHTDPKTKYENC